MNYSGGWEWGFFFPISATKSRTLFCFFLPSSTIRAPRHLAPDRSLAGSRKSQPAMLEYNEEITAKHSPTIKLLSGIFPGLVPTAAAPVPFGITSVFDKARLRDLCPTPAFGAKALKQSDQCVAKAEWKGVEIGRVLINDRLSINHHSELFLTSTESFNWLKRTQYLHRLCNSSSSSSSFSPQSVSAWCCVQGQCYY